MNMAFEQIVKLQRWLPDRRALADLKKVVEIEGGRKIELDSGMISVGDNEIYEVISKSLIEERFDTNFGCCFRVDVAIGGGRVHKLWDSQVTPMFRNAMVQLECKVNYDRLL
jgi:hypothetical protein